jgi:beta-glucanase (GH16 family)
MSMMLMKNQRRMIILAICVVLIGTAGILLLNTSRASVSTVSVEPEQGTLSDPGLKIHDTSASGSSAIRFSPSVQKPGYRLTFDDEFNGTSLDTAKWNTCYPYYSPTYNGCAHANNELEWYTPSQVSVANGSGRLTADKRTVQGIDFNGLPATFTYVSGMITTARYTKTTPTNTPLSQSYGYFEARLKIPSGKGLWPAFWLLPADNSWPPELDIMETVGTETTTNTMSYHWLDAGVVRTSASTFVGPDFSQGWHTFAADWEPGQIDWYVDGVLRKTYTNASVTNTPMYVLINLAVGGDWPGAPDATTVFPSFLDIDYVRTYQKL